MNPKRILAASSLALLLATSVPATILAGHGQADAKYKDYKNCTALNKVYKHGVGKPGAKDHVSGHSKKVTNFYVSKGLYNANSGKDRDGDGIACEKL
jgi:hypothetical protein